MSLLSDFPNADKRDFYYRKDDDIGIIISLVNNEHL